MATGLSGAKRMRENLRRAVEGVRAGLRDELDAIAKELLQESRNLAPQLSGRMIRTAGIGRRDTATRFRRSVFYRERYALFQHEGFYNAGPITRAKPGAGRKFLQRPFEARRRADIDRLGRRIARELRQALR